MRKIKRNVGLEILEGIREIKRGEHVHITTVPSIAAIREKTGLSQAFIFQAQRNLLKCHPIRNLL